MKAINLSGRSNNGHYHYSIDVDMNIIIEKIAKIGKVIFWVSLVAAALGAIAPFFYEEGYKMSKNEIFWFGTTQIVSVVYIYLVVRYRRKFSRILITKNGERFFLPLLKFK